MSQPLDEIDLVIQTCKVNVRMKLAGLNVEDCRIRTLCEQLAKSQIESTLNKK